MKSAMSPPNWLRSFKAAARLGTKLFVRLVRGLELTDQGKSFLPAVQKGFNSIKRAAADLFGSTGPSLVSLRVNTSFAYCWLASRVAEFQASHPTILLRIYLTIGRTRLTGKVYPWRSAMVMGNG